MVNKVIIVGNMCGPCELRYTGSGTAVGSFSVATNRRWKDKSGQQQEEVEFHRIVVWEQTAKYCDEYLGKGSKVYVEGSLKTRKWQDKEGNDKYTTEIIAQTVQNLSPKSDGNQQKSFDSPPNFIDPNSGEDQVPF